MSCPPMYQVVIIGSRMTYFPINLRDIIIYPTIINPHQHICIQIIIILKTACITSIRIIFLVAVDTKRRNTELHPRLTLAHSFVNFLYQHIHVVTAPIGFITVSATILRKTDMIRKIFARVGIRIEIIIHMNGIHIITGNNIAHNLANVFTVFGQSRIKIKLPSIIHETFRILIIRMNG